MANFDVSFLNPKLKKTSSTDYGFLIDQLDIKKNQLEADGKLSPGDYKILTQEAQKLYSHPGLTNSQRSSIDVKISSYKSDSSITSLKDTQNLNTVDRDIKDGHSQIQSMYVNNPEKFIQAKGDLIKSNIDELNDIIDQMETANLDASAQYDKRDTLMQDYSDSLYALNDVQTENPNSNYGAYTVTNSRGEVVDIKIGKIGTTKGYLPTNGTYGGLPLYGKANRTNDAGKNVFTLGSKNFVESENFVSTPDGTGTVRTMIMEGSTLGKNGLPTRNVGFVANAPYAEVTSPTSPLKAQSIIAPGGYGEGSNGFLYKRSEDGNSYTKYIGTDKEKLGVNDGDVMRLPSYYEQSVLKDATQTIDNTPSIPAPLPVDGTMPQTTSTPPATTTTEMKGTSNTGGAPEVRSPQTAKGIASDLYNKAKGFLGGLFGK